MLTNEVVTFRDGETLHNVTIVIIDDLYAEPTEYFSVRLEAIGQEVVVFPITECTIEIDDNDCKCDTLTLCHSSSNIFYAGIATNWF